MQRNARAEEGLMSFGNDSASLARTAAPPASIGFHGVHAARLPYLQGSAKRRAIGCVNSPPRPDAETRNLAFAFFDMSVLGSFWS